MRYFLLLFFLSFSQQQTISVVDREVFSTYIQKGFTLLDVRTPDEFKQGHIEGAENFNYYQNNFIQKLNIFDKKEPLLVYCRSGNRSYKAAKILDSLGFKEIIDLKGGFLAWEQ